MYSSRTLRFMKLHEESVKIRAEQEPNKTFNEITSKDGNFFELQPVPTKGDTTEWPIMNLDIDETDEFIPPILPTINLNETYNLAVESQPPENIIFEFTEGNNEDELLYVFPFPESCSKNYCENKKITQDLDLRMQEPNSACNSSQFVPETNNSNNNSVPSLRSDSDQKAYNVTTDLNRNNVVDHGDMNEGRKRQKNAQPQKWKKNKSKQMRMQGKEYVGYKRSKKGHVTHDIRRKARIIGPPCSSKQCLRSKNRKCSEISEENRQDIFTKFWSMMNWEQRKVFIISNVSRIDTKRKYTTGESNRKNSFIYTLAIDDNNKKQVCQKMFLSTLNLGEFTIRSWIKKSEFGMIDCQNVSNRTRNKSVNKTKEESKKYLIQFLNMLPKLPSHYGRRDSSKLYLEQTIQSLAQLFRLYSDKCNSEEKAAVSRTIFNKVFYSMNISLHHIKKDLCNVCTSHEVKNLGDAEWTTHVQKKDRARLEKTNDKEDAKNNEIILLTMDLQAVKVAPCLQASAIFFKTKLSCHNFTVYNTVTHHTVCYWFTESECDLTASTFATCIIQYLTAHCLNTCIPVVIFSDGCTYQNRNAILSNALLDYAVRNNVVIIQKYLEPGHTQMECDSVHSCIERKLKGRTIKLPSDYLAVTREARIKPCPYEVKAMEYHEFKDYTFKQFQRYPSIRPGKSTHDPVTTDIRAIKYLPEGMILVKLDYDGEWQKLPHRIKSVPDNIVLPQLYKEKRKIKFQKWKHLQELKTVLPADCHHYYDSIPHETNN